MRKAEYYFGIDVGGTCTKVALVDERVRILAKSSIPSLGFSGIPFFIKSIKTVFYGLLASAGLSVSQTGGIGLGLPGPVDSERGLVLSLTNIKNWRRVFLAKRLKEEFGLPVFIDNDANCMTLAEARLGAAKNARSALCLTLGTGVGGGLILDGHIYRGSFFLGGEAGHVPVSFDGPRCACGGRGCLERYVGNQALLRRVREEFGRDMTLEEVSRMARKGRSQALEIWRQAGGYVGLVVSGIVNVFGPEVVVIGGGVASAGECLLSAIRRTVKAHVMTPLKRAVKIKRAVLGPAAGVLGACLLAKEKLEGQCRG